MSPTPAKVATTYPRERAGAVQIRGEGGKLGAIVFPNNRGP